MALGGERFAGAVVPASLTTSKGAERSGAETQRTNLICTQITTSNPIFLFKSTDIQPIAYLFTRFEHQITFPGQIQCTNEICTLLERTRKSRFTHDFMYALPE